MTIGQTAALVTACLCRARRYLPLAIVGASP